MINENYKKIVLELVMFGKKYPINSVKKMTFNQIEKMEKELDDLIERAKKLTHIILLVFLFSCNSNFTVNDLNGMNPPIIVKSKSNCYELCNVLFIDGDGKLHTISSSSFFSLNVGDTIRY